MSKYWKMIVAGPLVKICVYPAPSPRDSIGVRAGKKAMSSEAQRRMNLIYAYQKLELLFYANFGIRDLYITMTYDPEHLPRNREEARKIMQAFWKKLRKERKKLGKELRYIYITEHRHGDGRWHHHAVINATGDDYDLIRKLWGNGMVDFKQIRIDRDKNFETLARYFCKEPRDKVGDRLWSSSTNLKKPKKETRRVPNDMQLAVPKSAVITFEDTGDIMTAYGHYRYIKYLAKGWETTIGPRPKAKRRRKRDRMDTFL